MSVRTPTDTAPPPSGPPERTRLETARAAAGLLRELDWLRILAGVVLVSIVFLFLGRWQWHRHVSRSTHNQILSENWNSSPVPLTDLVPAGEFGAAHDLPDRYQYRPVTLTGHYLTAGTILLRNRPIDTQNDPNNGNPTNGYEVAVPFQTTDPADAGAVIYIDRGWIPAGSRSAARPDSVPAPPSGTVHVVARLMDSEQGVGRPAPAGESDRLNVIHLGARLGPVAGKVAPVYASRITETPAAANTPTAQPRPDPSSLAAINLAYAIQWVVFAVAAYVMLGVAMVREVRRRDDPEGYTAAVEEKKRLRQLARNGGVEKFDDPYDEL
jgi:cytochrome oxidase assembly protein ShyY1